jgi:trk system potassium uptake protein
MNVIIVGCGRVGSELALLLSREGNNVAVVDNNKASFHRLGGTFNGLCVTGNGFDLEVLRRAGVESADAFVVVTNGDNTNIMASQVAKKIFNVPKVIARVYDPRRADIYKRFGLEIISGTTLLVSMIRDKLIESRFSGFFIETRGMGIIEINVTEDFVGKTVSELNRPDEFLIATIIKKNNPVIPSPMTRLELGDVLIGIVRTESVKKIKSMFNMED